MDIDYTKPNPYFTYEWLAEGQIMCYRFTSTGREAADRWLPVVRGVFERWPEDKPFLMLMDLRGQESIVSAHALSRARQVSYFRPELRGRTALITGSGLAMQVLASLLRSGLAKGSRERQMFSSEVMARDWLLKAAEPLGLRRHTDDEA